MKRTPHMDQLISKIYRQRKNQTPNDYSRDLFSNPTSNQISTKDLLNLTAKQKLNKSCNYNSNIHQRLQSKNDMKSKLLDEILRGQHSNISTSYLISTLKEKISKKVQKYNTCEEGSSFIIPEKDLSPKPMLKILENSLFAECQTFKENISVNSFQELLEKMELKEQQLKISIFSDLRKIFNLLVSTIKYDQQNKQKEIELLDRQNNSFKLQISEMNQKITQLKYQIDQQEKQLKVKNEENFISIMNTLRSYGVDPRMMLKKCQDTIDNAETCKIKQEEQQQQQQSEHLDESQKYSSDDSIPFVDPQTINQQEKKGMGFSLNLKPLKDPKKAPIGYQDEFMANINEFSESWRQQALAEKRF